jgi:hypothetical protein
MLRAPVVRGIATVGREEHIAQHPRHVLEEESDAAAIEVQPAVIEPPIRSVELQDHMSAVRREAVDLHVVIDRVLVHDARVAAVRVDDADRVALVVVRPESAIRRPSGDILEVSTYASDPQLALRPIGRSAPVARSRTARSPVDTSIVLRNRPSAVG